MFCASQCVPLWGIELAVILSFEVIPRIVDCEGPRICGKNIFIRGRISTVAERRVEKVHDIKKFPFLASIRTYDRAETGEIVSLEDDGNFVGTIVGTDLVMTACICVATEFGPVGGNSLRYPEYFGVTAGTLQDVPYKDNASQFSWAWRILVHPKCNISVTDGARYDVALLVVEKPFELIPDKMVPLAESNFHFNLADQLSADCRTVGWGWGSFQIQDEHSLIEPSATLRLSPSCGEVFSAPENYSEQSCLHLFPKVVFTGDAGSPILCTSNGHLSLVGIRSLQETKNDTHNTVSFIRFDDDETLKWLEYTIKNHPSHRSNQITERGNSRMVILFCYALLLTPNKV